MGRAQIAIVSGQHRFLLNWWIFQKESGLISPPPLLKHGNLGFVLQRHQWQMSIFKPSKYERRIGTEESAPSIRARVMCKLLLKSYCKMVMWRNKSAWELGRGKENRLSKNRIWKMFEQAEEMSRPCTHILQSVLTLVAWARPLLKKEIACYSLSLASLQSHACLISRNALKSIYK